MPESRLIIDANLMPNLLAHVYACLNALPSSRYKCEDKIIENIFT